MGSSWQGYNRSTRKRQFRSQVIWAIAILAFIFTVAWFLS